MSEQLTKSDKKLDENSVKNTKTDEEKNFQSPVHPGWLIALLVLIGAAVAAFSGGPPLALIYLAASALCLCIFLLWSSLQRMGEQEEMEFEEALSLAAPTATEEQKLAVLRALKDLEYELSVGKISKEDFDQANAEYRAKARELIYSADEKMKKQMAAAEKRVEEHLKQSAEQGSKKRHSEAEKQEVQS